MAAINSLLNVNNSLLNNATLINTKNTPSNLAVFEYFLPKIKNKRVTVIGRYPGIDRYAGYCDLLVVEKNPQGADYPEQACEYLLPESEWVFITGTSIPNKTFPRLMELSRNSNVVLMGPTVPWLAELCDMGVDYLAGIKVEDPVELKNTVAEGGGTRIFERGVNYYVADMANAKLNTIKKEIAEVVAKRDHYKAELEAWQSGFTMNPVPRLRELEKLDYELSELDTRYKKLWDARNSLHAFSN